MQASSVIEFFSAVHQSRFVSGDFAQRGGIIVIAPPGMFKSTLIKLSLEDYPDALVLSDMNVQTLNTLKNSLLDGRYSTLGFGEFEKLYQRNPATAANIEGHLKMLVEEGYDRASFEDQRAQGMTARCALIGGITPSCYTRRITAWLESGFARRFIFCAWRLHDPEAIIRAIEEWKLISFGRVAQTVPGNKKIPYTITEEENTIVRDACKTQHSLEGPFVLCKKVMCVLKWRHGKKKAIEIFKDFAQSMTVKGADLEV